MISIKKRPEVVYKGWGNETIVVNNQEYCGKILRFNKGKKFSCHFHILKHETFYVLMGKLNLRYYDLKNADNLNIELIPGDIVTIPRCEPHQIESLEESVIIEFSTHHEDSDSYRIAKGDSQK